MWQRTDCTFALFQTTHTFRKLQTNGYSHYKEKKYGKWIGQISSNVSVVYLLSRWSVFALITHSCITQNQNEYESAARCAKAANVKTKMYLCPATIGNAFMPKKKMSHYLWYHALKVFCDKDVHFNITLNKQNACFMTKPSDSWPRKPG